MGVNEMTRLSKVSMGSLIHYNNLHRAPCHFDLILVPLQPLLKRESKMAAPIRSNVMAPFRHKAIFSALFGRLTQLRNYSQAVIDHEANDISTGSEMPFMVPPQVVRKGFEVHPTPRTFTFKPDEKMKWLTKTYLTEGLPDELLSTDCDKESINFVKDCLHQIFGFQVHPRRPSNTFFEEELSLGLLQQMMQVAMMTSPENSQDMFIHRRPIIETNWFRNYVFYHAKYHPSFALRVSDKLPAMKSTFPLPIGNLKFFKFKHFTYSHIDLV